MSLDKAARIMGLVGALGLLTLADVANTGELSLVRLAARLLCLAAVFGGSLLARQSWLAFATAVVLSVLSAAAYALSRTTGTAWFFLISFWILLSGMQQVLGAGLRFPLRWMIRAALAVLGAAALVVVDQMESGFADEEFFVAVNLLLVSIALYLVLTACGSTSRSKGATRPSRLFRVLTLLAAAALLVALAAVAVQSYRASFYPASAPVYPGLTSQAPFLCGELEPASGGDDGEAVWERMLARLEAQPKKTAPHMAFLALARSDEAWARAFREALLAEVRAEAYTGPANSVKSVQFDAAWLIHFAGLVRGSFPGLFSADEWTEIERWVVEVNRRALRSEWVDWLYAFAFDSPVQGPYFNQEIGAALLSVLNRSGLVPDALRQLNEEFLDQAALGWGARFRYSDDVYYYQTVWLVSAYLQSLADENASDKLTADALNRRLAFEWLLVQARPDGAAPHYNHPVWPDLAAISYLGATLLNDPRFVWLADRALAVMEANNQGLTAIPGLDGPVQLDSRSPTIGSCLVYGGSGLPTSSGPLAPDKIVFRDGWTDDATWLALNLRFTGWHRYKASNHLIGLYQGGDVVVEQGRGRPYDWLPAGRSLPRDKRLAREDMNGLQVPRRGMGRVLWMLTGQGSQWAQDPPAYARVERFETLGGLDLSRTVLDDWRGWDHARTIYFFPGGPVVLLDEARARSTQGQTAITWHLAGAGHPVDDGILLEGHQGPVRMSWPSEAQTRLAVHSSLLPDGGSGWDVVYHSPDRENLDLATVYLGPDWVDSEVEYEQAQGQSGAGWYVEVEGTAGSQRLLHNPTPGRLDFGELSTDGLAVTVRQLGDDQPEVCYVGGTEIRLDLDRPPSAAVGGGVEWSWSDGVLVLKPGLPGTAGCVQVQE